MGTQCVLKNVEFAEFAHHIKKSANRNAFPLLGPACRQAIQERALGCCSRPLGGQDFGLFEYQFGGGFLQIRWITILAQEPLDQNPYFGPGAVLHRPVDSHIGAHSFN